MFTKILVPLDGTERAEQALPTAARLARADGSTLALVRVVPMPPITGPFATGSGVEAAHITESERGEANEYLSYLSSSPTLHGITKTRSVVFGASAATIVEEVKGQHADLVVMTTHGRAGFDRWMLGSVAEEVARHATAPVLIMRANGPQLGVSAEVDHLTRAVIALDGSPLAERAIAPAVGVLSAIAGRGKGTIHLVQVINWLSPQSSGVHEDTSEESSHAYLTAVAKAIETKYPGEVRLPVTWSTVVHEDAATSLIRLAERGDDSADCSLSDHCDLIVMATHGRSGVLRWALGSVTERVLSTTAIPLLVAHAADTPNLAKEG